MGENLNKLISLTFDEKPEVRIKAAESLEKLDDPGAVFALVELSYDKDPKVRESAENALAKKKTEEKEVLSFAELFAQGKKTGDKKEKMTLDAKEKLLSPISAMFERQLGKDKAERVKTKMMPTIERIYHKASRTHKGKKATPEDSGRKVIQEFLTGYLEAISDIDQENGVDIAPEAVREQIKDIPEVQAEETVAETVVPEAVQETTASDEALELEEVGKESAVDRVSADIQRIENDEYIEMEGEKVVMDTLPNTFFKKAYETMMVSEGDEDIMKREMDSLLKSAENDLKIAFKVAKKKFKEKKITNITNIKDGTRNINTDLLDVKEVENIEYVKSKRSKEKAVATRIVVNDENGNEGVVYLFEGRGMPVQPGMKIKVVKGQAKTFDFSGETGLTVGKRGDVYIVL